jgi:hypothetical protein
MSSDPHTLRNVADVWLATAFASRVFPKAQKTKIVKLTVHMDNMWEIRKARVYGDNPDVQQSQSQCLSGDLGDVAVPGAP